MCFVDGRRAKFSLFWLAYVTMLRHPLVNVNFYCVCFQAKSCSSFLQINVHRLINILIVGHLGDADIRQCINNHINLIYCVYSPI